MSNIGPRRLARPRTSIGEIDDIVHQLEGDANFLPERADRWNECLGAIRHSDAHFSGKSNQRPRLIRKHLKIMSDGLVPRLGA